MSAFHHAVHSFDDQPIPPQVRDHSTEPVVDCWIELDSFVRGAIIAASAVDTDAARGRIAAYDQVRREIAHLVAGEREQRAAEAAHDAEEARWRDDPSLGAGASVEAWRG